MMVLALVSAAVWIYLIAARGGFWRTAERDEPVVGTPPATEKSRAP